MKRCHLIILLSVFTLASCKTPLAVQNNTDDEIDVGYGTVRKDNLTTSVSGGKMDSRESDTYSDMYEYLRGRVAGVEVRGHDIRIRGVGTINSSNAPLIMVDGVTCEDLSYVNPRDVASVEVLKDSSASIYGVRGSNGVILIKTKKPE